MNGAWPYNVMISMQTSRCEATCRCHNGIEQHHTRSLYACSTWLRYLAGLERVLVQGPSAPTLLGGPKWRRQHQLLKGQQHPLYGLQHVPDSGLPHLLGQELVQLPCHFLRKLLDSLLRAQLWGQPPVQALREQHWKLVQGPVQLPGQLLKQQQQQQQLLLPAFCPSLPRTCSALEGE